MNQDLDRAALNWSEEKSCTLVAGSQACFLLSIILVLWFFFAIGLPASLHTDGR